MPPGARRGKLQHGHDATGPDDSSHLAQSSLAIDPVGHGWLRHFRFHEPRDLHGWQQGSRGLGGSARHGFSYPSQPLRRWRGELVLSIYNAYARKNVWALNFVQDNEQPDVTYPEVTYLFSIVPALTYNFIF